MTNPPAPGAPPPPETAPPGSISAGQPGKWRAILIVGAIGLFLVIVLWVVRNNINADDLSAGNCFNLPAGSSDFSTVTRTECTEAHDAEVFHVTEFTDGTTYPISLRLESFVDDACSPAFETYVGKDVALTDDLTFGYFYPTRDGWDGGDRTITCYVVRVDDAKLTKSLKGSGGVL